MRVFYRMRQFWHALTAAPCSDDLALAQQALSPSLMALFLRMQASEQVHSLSIFCQLREQDDAHSELLVAALLHDAGKSCYPLQVWERVLIVLGKALFPGHIERWGQGEPRGWKRPFVVSEQHANWGAELAVQAGASPLTAALIRRHQDKQACAESSSLEDCLLYRLQLLDNER